MPRAAARAMGRWSQVSPALGPWRAAGRRLVPFGQGPWTLPSEAGDLVAWAPGNHDSEGAMTTAGGWVCVDGNEAAALVAHRLSEVVAIYPITPASAMGEL